MGIISKTKKAIAFYKSNNKRKLFDTIRAVLKKYGLRGLITAIFNKLNGRPLLIGLYVAGTGTLSQIDYGVDLTNYDVIGEDIFQKQQSEYTEIEICKMIALMKEKPLISVIMPIYNPPLKWLKRAIESLQKQYYKNWELCAVDDGSKDGRGASLVEEMARSDSRIHLVRAEKNGGIASASNISLKMCKGEYTALLDQDDEITHDALFWVAKTINEDNCVDFMYTDECKIDASGSYDRSCFFFKPDWSPSLMINYMYSSHLTVYKVGLIRQAGGFRSEFDFSQDYDLALRVGDLTTKIVHIERVLYYWRTLPTSGAAGGKDYARISNIGALHDWYKRQGLSVIMEMGYKANYGRIQMKAQPKVSIIIPTDSLNNLKQSIQGLLTKTSYTNIEIIPVTNSKVAVEIEKEYPYLDCLKVCHYNKVYNFSAKCNEGARTAVGEIIIFYNDDVLPLTRDWIEKQIEIIQYPNVGGVSPLLLHEDQTIQYAGLITGTPGMIGTSFNGRHYLNPVANTFNHQLLRDVSILCGAVMTMKKEVFFEVGGFDAENTPNGHSDLDLSLKLLEKSYRCVYTPYAVLTHIGNHSWAEKKKADKADILCLKRWGKYLARDRYFTDSMKTMFYEDFGYKYRLYCPESLVVPQRENSKDILFISHELTRTGAPVVLKDMVQLVLNAGNFPVVLCTEDGPLKQEYLDMGVTVVIDESLIHGHWMFEHFARNFDLVVVNTLACGNAIKLLENSLPSVIWWVHEGSFAIDHFKSSLPDRVGKNVKVYCGGHYALEKFKELKIKCEPGILNYGVEDRNNENLQNSKKDKMRFLLAATYEKRKGQDIFVRAIEMLDCKYRGKAEFVFIGNVLENDIFEKVEALAKKNKDVIILESVTRDELFEIYKKTTCVVSPSRDDPMPVVMTEAMMLSKICICSSNTGTAEYIKDGENGFVFQNKNAEQLAKKLAFIIDNNDKLDVLREKSREIYEQNFSMDVFSQNIKMIMEELV